MLYNLVSNYYNNVLIIPVKPQYIFSTNDTVVYTFERLGIKQEKFWLISESSCKNSDTKAVYKVAHDKQYNGIWVKLTYTFLALGSCAPIFVSVKGLSKYKLLDKPILILKIEGMCIRGSGVWVGAKQHGLISFMRSDKDDATDKQ